MSRLQLLPYIAAGYALILVAGWLLGYYVLPKLRPKRKIAPEDRASAHSELVRSGTPANIRVDQDS